MVDEKRENYKAEQQAYGYNGYSPAPTRGLLNTKEEANFFPTSYTNFHNSPKTKNYHDYNPNQKPKPFVDENHIKLDLKPLVPNNWKVNNKNFNEITEKLINQRGKMKTEAEIAKREALEKRQLLEQLQHEL